MSPDDETQIAGIPKDGELAEYICERCGFHYKKQEDFPPFLCYRCIRFMAKRTWTTVKTVQPVVSHIEPPEV